MASIFELKSHFFNVPIRVIKTIDIIHFFLKSQLQNIFS